MFAREKTPVESYCGYRANFVMENVYQAPVLYTACNSMGEFCTITADGNQFIFTGSSQNSSYVNITATVHYTGFYLGLSGLIVGLPKLSETGQTDSKVVCYDLACPNCYQDYNIVKSLTLKTDGTAICTKCNRNYDLNKFGTISNGVDGISLFRYRVSYANNTLNVNNNESLSYPPTWKGFQFTRGGIVVNPETDIFAGDRITITALQAQKGHLINATTYSWEVKSHMLLEDGVTYKDSVIYTKTSHSNYDGLDNGDPSITFIAPENNKGQFVVYFKATYAYSANGIQIPDSCNYELSDNVFGNISSTSGVVSGTSSGTVSFIINNESPIISYIPKICN